MACDLCEQLYENKPVESRMHVWNLPSTYTVHTAFAGLEKTTEQVGDRLLRR
jgi:hypothetical protein